MAFSKHPGWMYGLIGLLIGIGAVAAYTYWETNMQDPGPVIYHAHVDFALFINGEKFNFAQEKYMTESANDLSRYVHLHDLQGDVVHHHAQNISIKTFLETLKFDVDENCVSTDENVEYCNNETHTWKVWVNGTPNENGFNYIAHDLDRILVTYGNENQEQLALQMQSVTDKACIQSEKCPERGAPSDESSCAGTGECETGVIPVGE